MQNNSIQLSDLTFEELGALEISVKKELSNRKATETSKLITEFSERAAALGLSVEDLMSTVKAKKQVRAPKTAVKYIDPSNAENTWTGRGRKPKWVAAFVQAGGSLESISV